MLTARNFTISQAARLAQFFAITDNDDNGQAEWRITAPGENGSTAAVTFSMGEDHRAPGWYVTTVTPAGDETFGPLATQDAALVKAAEAVDFDFGML